MSGGVDSSVAAALLREQGHECVGVTLHLWDAAGEQKVGRCCAPEDRDDARKTCEAIGIPHYVIDEREAFRDKVVDPFVRAYAAGDTPSPCVTCNQHVKLGRLAELADALGCTSIATGHYAQVARDAGAVTLLRGVDARKDQSYFLFGVPRPILARLVLPLGALDKGTTREEGRRLGVPNWDKKDSQELCFVPDGNVGAFVEREGVSPHPGELVSADGEIVGQHAGIHHFTVGQRRGLGLGGGPPRYVLRVVPERAEVVVGGEDGLYAAGLRASSARWIDERAQGAFDAEIQVRLVSGALSSFVSASAYHVFVVMVPGKFNGTNAPATRFALGFVLLAACSSPPREPRADPAETPPAPAAPEVARVEHDRPSAALADDPAPARRVEPRAMLTTLALSQMRLCAVSSGTVACLGLEHLSAREDSPTGVIGVALDISVRCLALDHAPWVTCDGLAVHATAGVPVFDVPMDGPVSAVRLGGQMFALNSRGAAVRWLMVRRDRVVLEQGAPSGPWVAAWQGSSGTILAEDPDGHVYLLPRQGEPRALPALEGGLEAIASGTRWCVLRRAGTRIECAEFPEGHLVGAVSFPEPIDAIAGDCGHAISGAVYCWQPGTGAIPHDPAPDAEIPAELVALPFAATAVAEEQGLGCAQSATGVVWCWGSDLSGIIDDDHEIGAPRPVDLPR